MRLGQYGSGQSTPQAPQQAHGGDHDPNAERKQLSQHGSGELTMQTSLHADPMGLARSQQSAVRAPTPSASLHGGHSDISRSSSPAIQAYQSANQTSWYGHYQSPQTAQPHSGGHAQIQYSQPPGGSPQHPPFPGIQPFQPFQPPQTPSTQPPTSYGAQTPQGYSPQGSSNAPNTMGGQYNPSGGFLNGPQPVNQKGDSSIQLVTHEKQYYHQPAVERGYANLFSDSVSRRVKWPNFYQVPGIYRSGGDKKHHRDAMGRQKEFQAEDFYLSPFDCHLAKLVVQCSQEVYDANPNSTWRRTFVRNMSPVILRVANWVLETVPKEDRPMTENEVGILALKWLPATVLLLFLMASPVDLGGQIRNGGRYDIFPYKYWGYPYYARNKIEDKPLNRAHFDPYRSEKSVELCKINPVSNRPLEPKFLCFLKNEKGMEICDVQEWKSKHHRAADYIFVSYTSEQFHTREEELFLHDVGEHAARKAGVAAYWVGCSCLGNKSQLEENVWRISDIIRGAYSMAIVVSNTENSGFESPSMAKLLEQWGTRVWTLPEILLSPGDEEITVYVRGESLDRPSRIHKRNMASNLEDGELSRQLIDHYEGSLVLGPLELITIALRCLHGRQKGKYLEGDMSYALMGLLRQRPTVVRKDSAFQAFARLSLANDSDALLERLICILPKKPDQSWHDMDDQWNVALWDIYPSTQICGIGEDDTIILDNAQAANIRWKAFAQVLTLQGDSWKRLFARCIFRSLFYIFLLGAIFIGIGKAQVGNALVALGAFFVVIGIILALLSPYLIRLLYSGKVWGAQPWFFGFEGYMNLHTIEKQIFGADIGYLNWSTAGSPLSRHSANEYGECDGLDPTTDPDTAARVRRAVNSRMGDEKIFTLVDTTTMTVTMFAAVRPPVAVVMCGQEGGMQRALLCSYDSTTQTLYRETVLRMETPVLDVMSRLGRFRFGLQRPGETYQNARQTSGV